jgi:hypothetical protein
VKRFVGAFVLALVIGVPASQTAAWAQAAGARLVIERAGSTTVVATRDVPSGITVRFEVAVDGVGLDRTFTVASGGKTEVQLPSLVPGRHTLQLVVVDPPSVRGAEGSFAVRSRFSPVAIIVVAGLVALLIFYRRRVLEPFSHRYDRPAPEDRPDVPPEDRPTS